MAKNRARKYMMLLSKKGWSDEEIATFCHIRGPRYGYLKKLYAVPQRIEVDRLRAMMKRSRGEDDLAARAVWKEAYASGRDDEKITEFAKAFVPTGYQLEVLRMMAQATRHGQPASVLARTEASVAGRLRKSGITFVHEIEVGKKTVKRYGLTRPGLAVCKALGIAAQAVPSLDSLVEQAASSEELAQGQASSEVASGSAPA